nr:hypothetical protein BaRGS_011246 [Batillaria attramentaria]
MFLRWWPNGRALDFEFSGLEFRTCFSLAIVCMVNHTALSTLRNPERNWTGLWAGVFINFGTVTEENDVDDGEDDRSDERCGRHFEDSSSEKEDGPFVWDKETQGFLLGAMFWTFALIQIPAGYVFYYAERAFLISIVWSGANIANAVVFPTSALLCKYGFAGGWPSVFYVFASWFLLVSDSPETHKRIDPAEREFIVANRASAHTRGDKVSVPWLKILTSLCFWGIAVAHFAYAWGQLLFLSNLPLFLYEVMKFDIKSFLGVAAPDCNGTFIEHS